MCGIAGLLRLDGGPVNQALLEAMTASLAHRGPDGFGLELNAQVGFGHRRLSIIDPAGGKQPMFNEDGRIWVTFNGEIYNYRELRSFLQSKGHRFVTHSDTETIVHAYEEWGEQCVERFRGMFAFAIMDWRSGKIFLARDQFGIKPLYYVQTSEHFAFASEIQALLKLPELHPNIDLQAVDQYLWLQYVPAPRTAFREIKKLPPAHRLSIPLDGKIGEPREFWRIEFKPDHGKSEKQWVDELDSVLKESVQAHLVSDVPFGAFLSGGIDSSLVVGYMSQILQQPVKTFSIGFEEAEFNETEHANFAARRWGADHHVEIVKPDALQMLPSLVRHYGDLFGDSSAIPTYYVSQMARSQVPMILSGDGADESFAGYWSYGNWLNSLANNGAGNATLPHWLSFIAYLNTDTRRQLWRPEYRHVCPAPLEVFEREFARTASFSLSNKAQYMDLKSYLPYDILTKVDIASMMRGLEVRTPFVDLKVVEFAATIPEQLNIKQQPNGQWDRKLLLKKVAGRYYPSNFINRPKMGFAVPLAKWFAAGGELNQILQDRLLSSGSILHQYFEPTIIAALLQHNFTGPLWLLLYLEEWVRQHMTAGSQAWYGEIPPTEVTTEILPQQPQRKIRRPRILILADVPNWIFERHALTLQRLLSDEFDIDVGYDNHVFREEDYDLIYPLEWYKIQPEQIRTPGKYITAIRSHLVWPDYDFTQLTRYLATQFKSVHVVSRRLYDIFSNHLPNLAYISHGVDTAYFSPSRPPAATGTTIRLGWAGNRKSVGKKGFAEIIEPLGQMPGVELVFCGYSDRNLTMEEMRAFYDSIDVYVCASDFEGNNNSLLEAASMQRAIITTNNGTVPEYLEHGISAMIVPREKARFAEAVRLLQKEPALRAKLGIEARKSVVAHWDWHIKVEDFRGLFRSALNNPGQARDVAWKETSTPVKSTVATHSPAMATPIPTKQHAIPTHVPAPATVKPASHKRVLLVCDFFWPSVGGVEKVAADLLTELKSRGYELEIATRSLPQRTATSWNDIPIHNLDAETFEHNANLPRATRQAAALIASGDYAAVIMLADPLNWVLWSVADIAVAQSTRVIVQPLINEEGYAVWGKNPEFRRNLRQILEKCGSVTTLTRSGRDSVFVAEEGVASSYLPNAAHTPPASGNFRRQFGIAENRKLLLHIGRIDPGKNQVALLHALRSHPGDWILVMAGPASAPADYLQSLNAAIAADARVHWLGPLNREDISSALEAADVLLLPSRGEVSPLVIIEAMSHRLAWIATPECGAAVENCGGLIAGLEEFPSAIDALLNDNALRTQLGNLGYRHWERCFQLDAVVDGWCALIEGQPPSQRFELPPGQWEEIEALRKRLTDTLPRIRLAPLKELNPTHVGGRNNAGKAEQPLVSVILPTFDRPAFLLRALTSISKQTYRHFEVLLINDHGVDVHDVLAHFSDRLNITYVRHGVNRGLAAARNTALKIARGEIVVYLDDDDRFLPHHIETAVTALQSGNADFVYTDAEYVIEKEDNGNWAEINRYNPFAGITYSRERLHIQNFIPVNAWAHRMGCLEQIGYFDESLKLFEDWDFLIRIARRYDIAHIPKITVEVHSRDSGDNMLTREKHRFLETYRLIYARYDDLGNPIIAQGRRQLLDPPADTAKQAPSAPTVNHDTSPDFYQQWLQRHRPDYAWPASPETVVSCRFILFGGAAQNLPLADTIDSLAALNYPAWNLSVIAETASPNPLFDELENLQWLKLEDFQRRHQAVNELARQEATEWLIFVPCGAQLNEQFLLALSGYSAQFPDCRLFYTDSDTRDGSGKFVNPRLRPDFNLDLLRSTHYMGDCLCIRRDAFLEVEGLTDAGPACLYDLVFKVADRYGENAIGHIDEILYNVPANTAPWPEEPAKQALLRHLQRNGIAALVSGGYQPGSFRVTYLHALSPKVSIIVSTRDQAGLLRECIGSILSKTSYPDYEIIIVDHQSRQRETLDYLDELQRLHADKIRVLNYSKPFNHSAMRNLAAKIAAGEYLLFLDNDTQVMQKEWLHLLMGHGQRPEVGVVAPKLVYPGSAKIQHAGVVMGMGGVADHPYMGLIGLTESGYMDRAQLDQELSAVSGACLLIRKAVFEQVGGMDEATLRINHSAIDLCLKVRQQGYKVVWTPYTTLIHHGGATQREDSKNAAKAKEAKERLEIEYYAMLEKWQPQIARDPSYNRHLSLLHRDYRVDQDFIVNWDPRLPSERTRILGWTLDGAPCDYRLKIPLRALAEAGAVETGYVYPPGHGLIRSLLPSEIARARPDIFTSSVFLGMQDHLPTLKQIKHTLRVPIVMQLDDFVTEVPKGSHAYEQRNKPGDLKKLLGMADRVVASTQPIADFIGKMCDDIQLVPNYLPKFIWDGLASTRRQGAKPRVGWAGAMQHGGDLALITEVVQATAREVDWVFFGMCPDSLGPFVREFHPFVPFHEYPAKLASLNLDLAIAPLEENKFNEGKSNLRLLEYGFMGWPVVCSDVIPYRGAPVKRVANKPQAWVEAIRERVSDLDSAEREGDILRQWVLDHWLLEDHLDQWARAYSFGL